jgi:hypothetical protein
MAKSIKVNNYIEYLQALKDDKNAILDVTTKEGLQELKKYCEVISNYRMERYVDDAIELLGTEVKLMKLDKYGIPLNYGILKGIRLKNSEEYWSIDVNGKMTYYLSISTVISKRYKPMVKRVPMKLNYEFSEEENHCFYDFLDKHLESCGKLDYCLIISVEDDEPFSTTNLHVKCNICGEEEYLTSLDDTLHKSEQNTKEI